MCLIYPTQCFSLLHLPVHFHIDFSVMTFQDVRNVGTDPCTPCGLLRYSDATLLVFPVARQAKLLVCPMHSYCFLEQSTQAINQADPLNAFAFFSF